MGREGGYRLLRRYGRSIRLEERRLKLGQYLFLRHGGKVVFFGRFVAVLRAWAAFLAGTNRMPWPRFLLFKSKPILDTAMSCEPIDVWTNHERELPYYSDRFYKKEPSP